MRTKCPGCGKRISSGAADCPECGYTLYRGELSELTQEVEAALSEVSPEEIEAIARQQKKQTQGGKLTPEEFEIIWQQKTGRRRPGGLAAGLSLRLALRGAIYEKELKAAYQEYLSSIGYD